MKTENAMSKPAHTLEVTVQWNEGTNMWMAFVGCNGLGHTTGILDNDPATAARRGLDAFIKRMDNDFGGLPGTRSRSRDKLIG